MRMRGEAQSYVMWKKGYDIERETSTQLGILKTRVHNHAAYCPYLMACCVMTLVLGRFGVHGIFQLSFDIFLILRFKMSLHSLASRQEEIEHIYRPMNQLSSVSDKNEFDSDFYG